MSDVVTTPTATPTAPAENTQAQGGESTEANEPDLGNMTAAEAREYLEKKNGKKEEKKESKPAPTPKKEEAKAETPKETEAKEEKKAAEKLAEEIRKFKVKINGKEEEVDEQTLIKGYSHQQAANKQMQEAKRAMEQSKLFLEALRSPEKLFDVLREGGGYNDAQIREFAENFLAGSLEEELMDPRDRELKKYKEMEARQKEAERIAKQNEEKAAHEAMKQKFASEYEAQFTQALKEVRVPANKETIKDMARYIKRAAEVNFDMTAKEAAQLVKEDLAEKQRHVIASLTEEELIAYLGDDTINKVRKYDTSRIKNPQQVLQTPKEQPQGRETTRPSNKGRPTASEWQRIKRGF